MMAPRTVTALSNPARTAYSPTVVVSRRLVNKAYSDVINPLTVPYPPLSLGPSSRRFAPAQGWFQIPQES